MTHFEHRVRERAYYIWEAEGRVFGRAEDHWLLAEAECQAGARVEPVRVEAVAPAPTLAPSPAVVLAEGLKAKPSRTRVAAAKVDAKVKSSVEATVEKAAKPVKKAAAPKSAAPKAAVVKDAKTPKVSARPRAAEPTAMVH